MKFEGVFFPRGGLTDNVSVITGVGGMFECINYSVYSLILFIPSVGNVFQAARTQAIYRLINAEIGVQTINIQALPVAPLQIGEAGVAPDYSFLVYFNSFQAGERDWYPPFSLDSFELPPSYSNTANANSSGALGIINYQILAPNPTPPLKNGYNIITGFDVGASSGALNRVPMTITGLLPATLNYNIQCDPNVEFFLNKEFPAPGLISNPNSAVTFNIAAGLASTQLTLNVFYYQVFN